VPDPFFIAPAPRGKHTVNRKEITRPTVSPMAQRADLVPCSQSAPFNGLVGSAVGSKARRSGAPQVCRRLAERSH